MNPKEHWPTSVVEARGPYIQIEAIFALRLFHEEGFKDIKFNPVLMSSTSK
jgi:hypothetical protein